MIVVLREISRRQKKKPSLDVVVVASVYDRTERISSPQTIKRPPHKHTLHASFENTRHTHAEHWDRHESTHTRNETYTLFLLTIWSEATSWSNAIPTLCDRPIGYITTEIYLGLGPVCASHTRPPPVEDSCLGLIKPT